MLDEEGVQRDPELAGQQLPQSRLGLLGSAGAHDPEPVGDPVHVGVDRDRRDPVAEDEHAVRGLGADARQRGERRVRARDLAGEPREDLGGDRTDHAGLRVIESRLSDERLDRGRSRRREARRVRKPGEQASARGVRRLIARPLGEDRPDEDLERVLCVVPEVRLAPVTGMVERGEPVEHQLPVEGRPARHAGSLRWAGDGSVPATVMAGRGPAPGSERSGSSFPPCASRSSSPMR